MGLLQVSSSIFPFNLILVVGLLYIVCIIIAILFHRSALLFAPAYFIVRLKISPRLAAIIATITLFLTGCRGSYIGMLVIMTGMFAVSAKYLWNNYKQIYLSLVGGVFALVTFAILLSSSLRARVLSIFAMRQDSSNSFRFKIFFNCPRLVKFAIFEINPAFSILCSRTFVIPETMSISPFFKLFLMNSRLPITFSCSSTSKSLSCHSFSSLLIVSDLF